MIHRVSGGRHATLAPPPPPPPPLELTACYRYCEQLARARAHNYPVVSWFVPPALRDRFFPLYAFARLADDITCEPQYEGRRARALDAWESRLERCFHDEPGDHPVFVALADTVHRFDVPITPFVQLLSGFRMDLDVHRYATAVDLLSYTAVAAAPLAHLALYMGGYRDASLHSFATELAHGLSLASFWQDLRADLDRDRVYVPAEDLSHFGVREDDLRAGEPRPAIDALIRYEVARTRALLARARPLVELIGADFAVEAALIWHGGMRILDKIEAAGAGVLTRRPRLTVADKATAVARALRWRGATLPTRNDLIARWLHR